MAEGSGSRLAAVLKNVITTEINLRAADLTTTEQNINTVREYLNKTRQAVCADFYDDNFKTTLQKPPHRAVKKTFAGKRPVKQESEESDPWPHSSSSPQSSGSQFLDRKKVNYETCDAIKEEPPDSDDNDTLKKGDPEADENPQAKYLDPDEKLDQSGDVEKRRPRYIPPVIPVNQIQHSLKPRGNKTMKKVRFLVRNNSKYILTPEDSSGATHKWSLNVKLNDESMDISQIVSKVVFYLHPSYKPHDVVTVHSAPFKITRRGWGEFDLRIKIFFINDKNEPAAVTHPLIFDKLHSGMETFGGETIFDHWINEPSEPITEKSMGQTSFKGDESNVTLNTEQSSVSAATPLSTIAAPSFDDFSTMPFTNETSHHFLSAIFGEPEELSAAKKDWEQYDDLFNLDDLAFPEFFGANDQKLGYVGKTRDGDLQLDTLKATAKGSDSVSNEKSDAGQSVSVVTSDVQEINLSCVKSESPLDSLPTVSEITVESVCDIVASSSKPESSSMHPSKVTSVCDSSDSSIQSRVCSVQPDRVESVDKEVFLSDLSEFGDEVIIMDSDGGQSDVQRSEGVEDRSDVGKQLTECVDYSSVEMDDLIKFPSDKPSCSGADLQRTVTNSYGSPVYVVATSKTSSPKKARRSAGVPKAPQRSALVRTGVNSVRKPRTPLLVTSTVPQSIVSNKLVTNTPPTTLLVSSSHLSSIITTKSVSNNSPTLLVSSSSLPSITNISPKGGPVTTQVKTAVKSQNRAVLRKVASPRNPNTNKISSVSTISQGGSLVNLPSTSRTSLQSSASMKTSISSANPVAISGGQPITLLSLLNTSSAPSVSKNAPIVISSPKMGSQATPTLLVPSSMILKPAFTKTVSSVVAGQVNSAQPLAPKPRSTIIPNILKMAPGQVRPGGTRFLVKMPDGTLKPINLETLTPLKPSELKMANPVAPVVRPQVLVPQQVLVRAPIPTSVKASPQPVGLTGVTVRGKRTAPAPSVPAKRRKTEPKIASSSGKAPSPRAPIILSASSQLVFKLPQSQNQLLVVPQAANQPVMRLHSQAKLQTSPIPISNKRTAIPTSTAPSQPITPSDSELPCNQIPKPEGMSILKRRPPETEVDARSLIDQCPKYSIEVSFCWLLRKFPLVHSRAGEESFKEAFPYCAVSASQFNQWPLAKRRAHELLRANDVWRLAEQIHPSCGWKKIDVIKFARLRGFTPLNGKINPSIHVHKPPVIQDRATLPDTDQISRILDTLQEHVEDIDVTCIEKVTPRCNVQPITESKKSGRKKIFMTLQGQLEDAKVVERLVERVSIYPEPEEIEPDVMFPAALRVLMSAFHSFAEDLIRRAHSSSYLRHNSTEPHNVASEDVHFALYSRKEFDIFTKQGFGTKCKTETPPEMKEPPESNS
ncbi:hypothetical protein GE061_002092 [Apolygus lucorum]|uniref:YEATS domain-containing protein n=1 Tax=Apolygus lucorum TaxID=248454 RepID=A0A6A4JF62_APOLU|nr:hypothetical protein GE061_002092 [Apolygus lucorum]